MKGTETLEGLTGLLELDISADYRGNIGAVPDFFLRGIVGDPLHDAIL
jgi:hypothetical protein